MTACRLPCPSCPWRVDQTAEAIPNFSLDLAEALAKTCASTTGESVPLGEAMFACHQSREGSEVVCAGWLAVEGHNHVGVRLNVAHGLWPAEALSAGADWPQLHAGFSEVIEKLRAASR